MLPELFFISILNIIKSREGRCITIEQSHNDKWLIVYSSVTGNTQQIAEALQEGLGARNADLFSIKEKNSFSAADYENIAVGYWLTRGAPDAGIQEFLHGLHNKTIILFQTQGSMLGSEHSVTAFARAALHLAPDNTVLGTFASQGKINPALLARRKADSNSPHSANERNKRRWAAAASHPDEGDLQRAREFTAAMQHKLELRRKYLAQKK